MKRNPYMAPALALAVFALYFVIFEDYGIDYWDTYIAAPATFATGRPCVFTDDTDQAVHQYKLRQQLPHDLVGKGTYGIVSKDQRIGAGITFAIPYLVFGAAGFRVMYAGFGALAFLLSFAAGRRLFGGYTLPAVLGLVVAINPFMLSMNRLNANFISVTIMMGIMALLLQERPKWLLVGLIYGALGGIRNEAIMLVPAGLLLMLSTRNGRRGTVLFVAGAVAGIAPYLAWNKYAFGKALIHASQYSDFEGWRPMFKHSLLGWEFQFNGLFNWPFHDHLVRTPHYPFPTYMTLPLTLMLCFGVVLSALGFIGLWAQWRVDRRWWCFLMLWIACCLGLFLFQENWEEPKTTFGALNIPPLAVFMVRGVQWMARRPRCWKRWATLAVAVLVLEGAVLGARMVEVPVDERWHVRFPKAKKEASGVGCLRDEQRREWLFFHTDECPSELAEQRAKLTRGNLLPGLYYPLRSTRGDVAAEWWHYEPKIFDIWEKIYGE